jgi:nuclear transport factor 2 (NTF2) superfamily protein
MSAKQEMSDSDSPLRNVVRGVERTQADRALSPIDRARRDPGKVALAYAIDSRWRNRSEFVNGRDFTISYCLNPRVFN